MNKEHYLTNLDIYEVEKADYESYVYRLKYRDLLEQEEEEGSIHLFWDIAAGEYVCGYRDTKNIASNSYFREFFIFEILPEDLLGPEKVVKKIVLSQEDYEAWLNLCNQVINKKEKPDDGGESVSTSC